MFGLMITIVIITLLALIGSNKEERPAIAFLSSASLLFIVIMDVLKTFFGS